MSEMSVSEKNKLRDKEINKKVDDVFRRAHRIRRIRRRRKLAKWLKSRLN